MLIFFWETRPRERERCSAPTEGQCRHIRARMHHGQNRLARSACWARRKRRRRCWPPGDLGTSCMNRMRCMDSFPPYPSHPITPCFFLGRRIDNWFCFAIAARAWEEGRRSINFEWHPLFYIMTSTGYASDVFPFLGCSNGLVRFLRVDYLPVEP